MDRGCPLEPGNRRQHPPANLRLCKYSQIHAWEIWALGSDAPAFLLMQLREELEAKPGSLHEGEVNNEFGGEIPKDKEAFHFCVN